MFSCYTGMLPRAHLSVCLCLCLSLIFSRRGQAKTEAIVERNKELNKELAHIVPDISTSAATQKKVAAQ